MSFFLLQGVNYHIVLWQMFDYCDFDFEPIRHKQMSQAMQAMIDKDVSKLSFSNKYIVISNNVKKNANPKIMV